MEAEWIALHVLSTAICKRPEEGLRMSTVQGGHQPVRDRSQIPKARRFLPKAPNRVRFYDQPLGSGEPGVKGGDPSGQRSA
jgi:hypothetical protein